MRRDKKDNRNGNAEMRNAKKNERYDENSSGNTRVLFSFKFHRVTTNDKKV